MPFNIDKLMTGVGIVIDDAISNDKDRKNDIFKIISQIEDKNIPLVKYSKLPNTSISHFKNVNFILLDWDLSQITSDPTEPISVPAGFKTDNIKQNIEFIKKIKEACFTPLFIFTKENTDDIINKLEEADLYSKSKHNFIFVENKSKLKTNLFAKVTNWLKKTSSIYTLKEWENTLNKAKNELFWDFYILNPDWPKVLWKAYKKDSINMSIELSEIISKNLMSRFSFSAFDSTLLEKRILKNSKDDFRKVLEGERFIKCKGEKELHTGDIFKKSGKYYLNIRPQCDCIPRNKKTIEDIKLYCLEGTKINNNKIIKLFDKDYGLFRDNDTNTIVFPINNGEAIDFRFKKLIKIPYNDLKTNRLGCLIPPYITKVQQKYSNYLHRPGLSRIPINAIKGK